MGYHQVYGSIDISLVGFEAQRYKANICYTSANTKVLSRFNGQDSGMYVP